MKNDTLATCELRGLEPTARMREMGVTGMVQHASGWKATFEGYGEAQFDLPYPVSKWLHEEE